jgi:hypothetical protein
MESTVRLSRIMKLSWDIQRRKRITRLKSLMSTWAILNKEDITVFYLITKLNHNKPIKYINQRQFQLFS